MLKCAENQPNSLNLAETETRLGIFQREIGIFDDNSGYSSVRPVNIALS